MKKCCIVITILLMVYIIIGGCKKNTNPDTALTGVIYGTITDYETGEPICNANVKLHPEGSTTLTGSDGSFLFTNVSDGNHSLSISKDGYADLDDDYIIQIQNGSKVPRNVQLTEAKQSFILTKEDNEIDTLFFGVDSNVSLMTYTILNNGNIKISVSMHYSGDWITVDYSEDVIEPDFGMTAYAKIKRTSLAIGNNIGYIYISCGSLTKTLVVSATGVAMPIVSEPELSNILAYTTTARSDVTDNGGCQIIDKGFEYAESAYYHNISLGPGESIFQSQIPIGLANYYPRVRAYAYNGVYTGYSGWIYINN